MSRQTLDFGDVVFAYESAGTPVFDGISVRIGVGWTGIIGPNGSGKTTFLRLACEQLRPLRGHIHSPQRIIYCPQRTDDAPADFDAFLSAVDHHACQLRGQLDIGADWLRRWATLSHGERKRAQIAVALWHEPRALAIDEPTNHIDLDARRLLAAALRAFTGIGLLVSHDRELLDGLCHQCLFLDPHGPVMRAGGYTKATALAKAEKEQARQSHAQAKRQVDRLTREAGKRRDQASRSHALRSKGRVDRKDHGAKNQINRARYTGKDGQAGRTLRQMDGRRRQAEEELAGIRVIKQQHLGIDLRGAQSQRDALFRLPAGSLPLGGTRCLIHPELAMKPRDRIALTGPNGAGKSTLVRHIVGQLHLPTDRLVYLAQEIDVLEGAQIISTVRSLIHRQLGDVMSVISCLGSDPKRVLETAEPSPGEVRKLILAMGMARSPHLIVMDEPTNHLDMPSIECLESALAASPCALLLVSHDLYFLGKLIRTRWEILADCGTIGADQMCLQVRHSSG